jgi:septal ring factor EnvC (AmiA/AmiB activator)
MTTGNLEAHLLSLMKLCDEFKSALAKVLDEVRHLEHKHGDQVRKAEFDLAAVRAKIAEAQHEHKHLLASLATLREQRADIARGLDAAMAEHRSVA